MERCNLKKLKETEGKTEYHITFSNRFTDLENLDDDADINRVWELLERI
jgi:hypothetical protein